MKLAVPVSQAAPPNGMEKFCYYRGKPDAAEYDAAFLRQKGIRAQARSSGPDGFLFVAAQDRARAVREMDPAHAPKGVAWPPAPETVDYV